MKNLGTVAVVAAAALLLFSLAFLGRVIWNRHAQRVPSPAQAEVAQGGLPESPPAGELQVSPAPAGSAAAGVAPSTGAGPQASGAFPAAGAASPGPGVSRRGGGFPRQSGTGGGGPPAASGSMQRPSGMAGGFRRPSGSAAGMQRPPGTASTGGSSAGAGMGYRPSGGGGAGEANDPRLAQWAREVRQARDTIDDAKVAIREHNQDQLIEILDKALAQLPDIPTATRPQPSGAPSPGPATSPTGAVPPAGSPGAASNLLALGTRVEELLYQELDLIRSLPADEYREQRARIVIGLLAELLMTARDGAGSVPGGPGGGPGMGAGGRFRPGAGPGPGAGRPGRPGPPATAPAPATP